ncbi:hypothetical protein ATM99_13885 [Cellulomonas sp. B6]|nr:hypothetical protein ATM99_13885 [Cellulomonas sp. B6]
MIVGAEKISCGLHPEKPWSHVIGRGFDSRHLHHDALAHVHTRAISGSDSKQTKSPPATAGSSCVRGAAATARDRDVIATARVDGG